MDQETFAAEVAAEWRARIEHTRAEAARGEQGVPMGRLIEAAAAEPVLRALFPWTSMACLSVSASTDFRTWGTEGIPGIVAWRSGFTVLEGHGRENTVLLETDDPVVAVAYLAGWLRERRR
ncbi:DUF6193 family natural product biosynthesis protein [Kitasatospora sp. NPDC056076]|uniref:DUF6193 family natural product biosynthesis protein n=1 Tax=Kitasatospora sp. NPDC056076 TaxID=3345703 RepID=UPI0035D754C9